jgi:hypothetical protein
LEIIKNAVRRILWLIEEWKRLNIMFLRLLLN